MYLFKHGIHKQRPSSDTYNLREIFDKDSSKQTNTITSRMCVKWELQDKQRELGLDRKPFIQGP